MGEQYPMMLKRISKKSSRNIYPTSVGRNLERNNLFFEKKGYHIISYSQAYTVRYERVDLSFGNKRDIFS